VLATLPNVTEDELDQLATARLARQVILDREQPPLLWAVIDEAVLRRPIGDAKVMNDQLSYLAEMADRPNITIQVIPYSAGCHVGLLGAFVVAEFDDAPGVVYLENAADGQTAEDASVVSTVLLRFDTLRSEALPRGASRDMIMKVAEQQWT
jgi:hypothetical protein